MSKAADFTLIDVSKVAIPGPGTYDSKSSLIDQKRGVGFGPERKIQMADIKNVPGPGQYDILNFKNTIHKEPNQLFCKSTRSNSTTLLVPGRNISLYSAGSYQPSSQFTQKKGFSIAVKPIVLDKTTYIPGPGT